MDVNDFKNKFSFKDGKVVNKTKSSKFKSVKSEIDGHTFDSKKEAEFYGSLKIKKNAGLIKDFKIQVQYDIVVNNIHIAYYYLDFQIDLSCFELTTYHRWLSFLTDFGPTLANCRIRTFWISRNSLFTLELDDHLPKLPFK